MPVVVVDVVETVTATKVEGDTEGIVEDSEVTEEVIVATEMATVEIETIEVVVSVVPIVEAVKIEEKYPVIPV